jgi:hypothetical protein
VYVGGFRGDYNKFGGHYVYDEHNLGMYDVNEVTDTSAWTEHFGAYDSEGNYVGDGNGDYTRGEYVPTTYKLEPRVVTIPAHTVPEFGIEFFIEIDGAHIDVTNPNNEPVNVAFQFDINYFVDTRPWDFRVDDGRIVDRHDTYYGSLTNVGSGISTYHGILNPSIDGAVTVVDWQHFGMQYVPTITNDVVTGTVWV